MTLLSVLLAVGVCLALLLVLAGIVLVVAVNILWWAKRRRML